MTPKEQAELIRSLKKSVPQWLEEENLEVVPLENPSTEFALRLKYHDVNIEVQRPKGRRCLLLAMGVTLSPQHQGAFVALPEARRRQVIYYLRRTAFAGGQIGFGPEGESGVYTRWVLDHLIYDDHISRHSLLNGLRMLFTRHLELIDTLSFHLEVVQNGTSTSSADDVGYL